MKNKILLFAGLLLINSNNLISNEIINNSDLSARDSINVFSSSDLLSLTRTLAKEYTGQNPGVKIKVLGVTDAKISDPGTDINLGFVSHEYYTASDNGSLWKIVIGRDILVPVINSKNPFMNEIYQKGISSEELARVLINPGNMEWGTLLENAEKIPVKYYFLKDESMKSDLAKFLNTDNIALNGIGVENGKEIISAIQKDPYAIGFCKMTDILDFKNQQIVENIKLMPIDRNGNGRIDYSESIYDNLNAFMRGVWIGKYPKALFNNIYSVSSSQPKNETEVAFLKWVLTDGQQFIYLNGYSDLEISERQSKLDKLIPVNVDLVASNNGYADLKIILLILAAIILAGFIIDAGIRYVKKKKADVGVVSSIFPAVFDENSITLLNGLYFDKTHTWAFMEKNGMVKAGIDDFLQHITGSITQLRMKNPGEKIKKGEPFLSIIQKGKQLNVYSPLSGIIKEHNQQLITNSSLVNTSPYSEGWIYMIEPSNWIREIQFLLMGDKYKKWLKDEFSRLKDFLSVFVKPGTVEYAYVILQDGGELKDNLLSDLGPEVWEEFQTNFIDTSK